MSLPALPSIDTIKRWIDYWRKFKGKRVRVFLRSGFTNTVTSVENSSGSQLEEYCHDTIIGTISEVVESPFGIWLTKIICPDGNCFDEVFIPMTEILRMYVYNKKMAAETLLATPK